MPITLEEYERFLDAPALCEQLRIRDSARQRGDPGGWIVCGSL